MSRAFPTSAPNLTSSDRSRVVAQQAIYQNIRDTVRSRVNQKNGNKPGSINYCLDTPDASNGYVGAKVRSAIDYSSLYDFSKGKAYCKPCNILLNRFTGSSAQSGNTLYENPNATTILSTAVNWCTDPSGSSFPGSLPSCGSVWPCPVVDTSGSTDFGNVQYQSQSVGAIDLESPGAPPTPGFIPVPPAGCSRATEAPGVIIDPSHNTFRANCNPSFSDADRPGPWVNRVRIANPEVMSEFAYNSYSKYLTGFSLRGRLGVNAYPPNTLVVNNCTKFPQYNGVYTPLPNITLPGPPNLVLAGWQKVGSIQTIIPMIGGLPAYGLPTLFCYALTEYTPADVSAAGDSWQPYSALECSTSAPIAGAACPASPPPLSPKYITNVVQLSATGFRPHIVRLSGGDSLSPTQVAADPSFLNSDWPRILRSPPYAKTFSAEYVESEVEIATAPFTAPVLREDVITINVVE